MNPFMTLAAGISTVAAALIAGAALCSPAAAGHSPGGIWKAVVPPAGMKGKFENHDPIGLVSGAVIKADCSLNWTDPDDGKLYCFASATSQSYFLDWPKTNIRRASEFWRRKNPEGEGAEATN